MFSSFKQDWFAVMGHLWARKKIEAYNNSQSVVLLPGPAKEFVFHAFKGCDAVSAFRGKGKRTAWQTLDVFPAASEVFQKFTQSKPIMTDSDLKILERSVVFMYDKSCSADSVDDAKMELFAWKQRLYQSIPLTKAALVHSAHQTCFIPSRLYLESVHNTST